MFRTVKGNYDVGWEFDYKMPMARNKKMTSRIAAIAACLLMALSMGTYSYQNLMVYATVTLHGTAPIQLDLNRRDKVIDVKAVDKSGEALAEQLLDSGIKGTDFQEAVAKAEQMMQAQNKGKEGAVLPEVKCKSSDKLRALTDALHQDKPAASQPTKPSTEQATTTTTTTTTADPGNASAEVSAQGSKTDETEQPTSETSAPAETQPSSSEEDISSQGDQEEITQQDAPTEITAQGSSDTGSDVEITAQGAPAQTEPAPAPAAEEKQAPAEKEAPAEEE
jgi:hypothetical protein